MWKGCSEANFLLEVILKIKKMPSQRGKNLHQVQAIISKSESTQQVSFEYALH
jgi:hypothetical protein